MVLIYTGHKSNNDPIVRQPHILLSCPMVSHTGYTSRKVLHRQRPVRIHLSALFLHL